MHHLNWLKKAATITLAMVFMSQSALALDLGIYDPETGEVQIPDTDQPEQDPAEYPTPSITNHSVSQQYVDPYNADSTVVSYCIDHDAQVSTGIYTVEAGDTKKVEIFLTDSIQTAGCYSETWYGKHGDASELGNANEKVDYGDYFYAITVKAVNSSEKADYAANWIYVSEDGENEDFKIIDSDVDNRSFDPYDRQEAELSFTLSHAAYVTVKVEDDDEDLVVELMENEFLEAGEHSLEWDGRDEFDEIVDQDDYQFEIRMEKDNNSDKAYESVRVKKGAGNYYDHTEDPRLKNVYVTKEEFDPGRNEANYIIFTLTAEADLRVTIYDQYKEVLEDLIDGDDMSPGTYAVAWDGDLALNHEGKYTYEIYAKNSKGDYSETGYIDVEEDVKPNNRPNVYKDHVTKTPYYPGGENLGLYFKLEERDAEVTIEIKDGSRVIRTLTDEQDFSEGAHTVYWDGRDKYGDLVDNGIYEYRIEAENSKGKDIEYGTFSVEGASHAQDPAGRCAIFNDVTATSRYCEAIEWAYNNEIFQGFNDGTFRPEDALTRAQGVKVILETLDVSLLPGGVNLGFNDTDAFAWHNRYIQTAMSLGIVNGYSDNSFKPDHSINRVEALKILLETGKIVDGIVVPTNTYGNPYFDTPSNSGTNWYISYVWYAKAFSLNYNDQYFYPNDTMTRAQMADLLYRYHLTQN